MCVTGPTADFLLVALVVIVVTGGWLVALLSAVITHDWEPLIWATPLMAAVVGYATGIRAWRNGESR